MAYTINKTDGTVVTTITDGTVDNTTSLQLFGKSYSGFGEGLNENLVKLLENSASTSHQQVTFGMIQMTTKYTFTLVQRSNF